jgi:hypothetical protein
MFARRCLLVTFVFVGLVWSATRPQAQNKSACDLIPLADISAAFGTEMFLRPQRGQRPEFCNYMSEGPFDRPTGPTVNLNISFFHEAAPDPDAVVDAARVLMQQRQVETTAVPGVGDAAFWFGNNISGELRVFRGGIETLTLSGQLPLDKLKTLAMKAMGGTGRTGFAYGGKPATFDVVVADTPVVGGSSFSQALYITQSEFLKQVKEVSVNIARNGELMKNISPSDQRSLVTKALAARGITVRAGAPVVAVATLDQHDSVGTTTITYNTGRTTSEKFYIHNIFVSLEFYTRAVVMRGGQAHVVTVAPARGFNARQYVEDNEIRKFLFGDETRSDMKDLVSYLLDESLEQISTNHAVDSTPWYANTWTAAQRASADAEFLRLMNSVPSDTHASLGVAAPQVELIQPATDDPDEACPEPNSWRQNWNLEIQRKRWTNAQMPSPFTVRHTFRCRHVPVFRFANGYYRLVDNVSLRESNAVFVLNGRVFRKPVTLVSTHRMLTDQGDNLDSAVQLFVPQSVVEFSGQVEIGNVNAPSIAPTAVRIAAGTASPDNAAARAAKHEPDSWEQMWNAPFYTVSQYTPTLARKGRMVLQGTVARVTREDGFPPWLRIYFKEAPDNAVTVCSPSSDIFDEFGTNYRGLIGRTLRAAGDIDGLCIPKGGIRVVQSNQISVYGTEPAAP